MIAFKNNKCKCKKLIPIIVINNEKECVCKCVSGKNKLYFIFRYPGNFTIEK